MSHEIPQSWLLRLPFLPSDHHYIHVNAAVVVAIFLIGLSILAKRALEKQKDGFVVPAARFSFTSVVDLYVEALYKMIIGIVGEEGKKYFPFLASLFSFIFFGNLLGLLPLSDTPSANINTTIGLGIASFIYYNYTGVRSHGLVGYLKHFLMGMGIIGIPIAFLEMISHIVRPMSLGLRLFVNMFVDHSILVTFQGLVEWLLPVPFLLFGLVVSTVQAFLFTVLTCVYVQMATEHSH